MIFLALSLLLLGAAVSWARGSWVRIAAPACAGGASILFLIAALQGLLTTGVWEFSYPEIFPWSSFHLRMDGLSAVFVILISLIGGIAALYGYGYLGGAKSPRTAVRSWSAYNILLASMFLVVLASDGFLFLFAWELMSLSSFFLVVSDHERPGVVKAGWIYLLATHAATLFLFVLFMLTSQGNGSDFSAFSTNGFSPTMLFVFALIGFGAKAGFVPLHIWLPEAHPAAPSHVSALMSGVMIKTGIYGILRVVTLLGSPESIWWGYGLVAIGVTSGLMGVLFALAQHDLKKLLAYHSIENIGIIALGLGLGLIGNAIHNPLIAILGFGGCLFHVINHGLFKSLLFMGAGAVVHATGTREIERLGGLLKKMPVSGATFLIASAAICALPPLNGFASEFLVYMAATHALTARLQAWTGLVVIVSLALIGGLALACFTKAFGIVFLGEPRSDSARSAHEAPRSMTVAMVIMAGLCVGAGLGAMGVIYLMLPAIQILARTAIDVTRFSDFAATLTSVMIVSCVLLALIAALVLIRRGLLSGREIRSGLTWDCGYAAPNARMQYTASSFADPLVKLFRTVLRTHRHVEKPQNDFPKSATLHTHTADYYLDGFFARLVRALATCVRSLRCLQEGHTHIYLLYIFATILILLVCNLH